MKIAKCAGLLVVLLCVTALAETPEELRTRGTQASLEAAVSLTEDGHTHASLSMWADTANLGDDLDAALAVLAKARASMDDADRAWLDGLQAEGRGNSFLGAWQVDQAVVEYTEALRLAELSSSLSLLTGFHFAEFEYRFVPLP